MFDWLLKPLGTMLAWFSGWSGSYAIALLFYALIFKLLFSFFSVKQQKNQIKMAKLAPKLAAIKEKYRGRTDQVTVKKMQEEMMELQQKEGYSPFSGCLPMLFQIILIFPLYSVIRQPLTYISQLGNETIVELYKMVKGVGEAAFDQIDQIGLVGELNAMISNGQGAFISGICGGTMPNLPNFMLWGMNLAATPNIAVWPLAIIPFAVAIFQWASMFISRKFMSNPQMAAAPASDDVTAKQTNMSMRIMDIAMPLLTLWMAFSFSAMLGLYWIYQSILGVVQTIILHKLMPIPKYTEEELKAMRKAQKAQEKAQRTAIKSQPKYKSLHYIDEEDYEQLPEIKPSKPTSGGSGNQGSGSGSGIPEIKD